MNALIDWLSEPILTAPPTWFWIASILLVVYLLARHLKLMEQIDDLKADRVRMRDIRFLGIEADRKIIADLRRQLREAKGETDTELDEILDRAKLESPDPVVRLGEKFKRFGKEVQA
jgi:hypothetical protein